MLTVMLEDAHLPLRATLCDVKDKQAKWGATDSLWPEAPFTNMV